MTAGIPGATPGSPPLAAADILPIVYRELRGMAARRLAQEAQEHTLQPTALVHEAWMRLAGEHGREWRDASHFFSAAAEAMRRILVDRARRRLAVKRGAGAQRVDLAEVDLATPVQEDHLLALNDALDRFRLLYPRHAELVKLRYFAGITFDQAAEALAVSVPTVKRWWAFSRAWLLADLRTARD